MQALSVPQPWAWAIARGHKGILNRASNTGYRGPVAIYASFRANLGSCDRPMARAAAWDPADPVAAIGGIVAVVSLAGVCAAAASGRPCRCGEWASAGKYHWRLVDPRPLQWPVMALGHPGLWELTPVVAAGVARLLLGQAAAAVPRDATRTAPGEARRPAPSRPSARHRRRAVHPLRRPN